ncbi:MAG: 2,3-diphosphoglycerate-dependent phosphoglycerate mutase [Gammaproteobacteria bacterium]|nr:2,3-diphosphoglycerate-dependent phosphoglycerate mutase [Gammaproteobacteria bacterium]
MPVGKLVLVRHGQSTWNVDNLFTGWTDVDLSPQGREEAARAGRELLAAGIGIDLAYTSVLKRAIRTLWIMLDAMDRMWIPVERSWRLNERHYGALQGLDKAETVARHGEAQVKVWRRSYDVPPPPLAADDPRHPRFDPRYAGIDPALLPATESLKETLARVQPYFFDRIAPQLLAGRNVMVVAHGNSLRALIKMLDGVAEADIAELNVPTGVPLVYGFEEGSTLASLRPTGSRYLGDPEAIRAAAEAVRRQTERR